MTKNEKKHDFIDTVKKGVGSISRILVSSISPPIIEGTEIIMKNIEDRIVKMEKRIIKKMTSLMIIGVGAIFLIFSLFFLLREYFNWNNTAAFFTIGIIIFVTGLLLKVKETED